MSKRVLYVGGLSDTPSDYQLHDLLGAYVVRYKHSGRSAGHGFVEMGSGEQAISAVVAMEDALFEGNCLRSYVTPYVSIHS